MLQGPFSPEGPFFPVLCTQTLMHPHCTNIARTLHARTRTHACTRSQSLTMCLYLWTLVCYWNAWPARATAFHQGARGGCLMQINSTDRVSGTCQDWVILVQGVSLSMHCCELLICSGFLKCFLMREKEVKFVWGMFRCARHLLNVVHIFFKRDVHYCKHIHLTNMLVNKCILILKKCNILFSKHYYY